MTSADSPIAQLDDERNSRSDDGERATSSASSVSSAFPAQPYDLPTVLSIAGNDPSGGAGIAADLKTFMACGVYGMAAVTAVTAQNTIGVFDSLPIDPGMLAAQIDVVFDDIRPDAVKIGMIPNAKAVETIAEALKRHHAINIVVDPVMMASSGTVLTGRSVPETMIDRLLPLATLVTPNIPEAEVLAGLEPGSITDNEQAERAGRIIAERCSCSVLVKGGHGHSGADDALVFGGTDRLVEDDDKTDNRGNANKTFGSGTVIASNGPRNPHDTDKSNDADETDDHNRFSGHHTPEPIWFRHQRITNPNTHGTGCTLSSAIAANLAKGATLIQAVRAGKAYLTGCIEAGLDLGSGSGPMDHAWAWRGRQTQAEPIETQQGL